MYFRTQGDRAILTATIPWAASIAGEGVGGIVAAAYGNLPLAASLWTAGLTQAFLTVPFLNVVYTIAQGSRQSESLTPPQHPNAFFYERFPSAQSCDRPDEPRRRVLHPTSLRGAFRLEDRI